jgi:hypothetical protein
MYKYICFNIKVNKKNIKKIPFPIQIKGGHGLESVPAAARHCSICDSRQPLRVVFHNVILILHKKFFLTFMLFF